MYSATPSVPASRSINGMSGRSMIDGSGTIDPAALSSSANLVSTSSSHQAQQSQRGLKRSRSPDKGDTGGFGGDDGNQKGKKRGKPSGVGPSNEKPSPSVKPEQSATDLQTPQQPPALLPQEPNTSPNQPSPTKSLPSKAPVIKALPTVRDHTTDQLTPQGDEYIPREHDPDGDRKVTPSGHPLDGREYKMRTFYIPNRGDKLFMLATECARVLGYRDSYLLFNKNRSLYKIIATQAEKDELIHQEILPYSYRSRQIAIVTARSMFRQFGARVILEGRRVRDDYWEGKAKKQGFTEEDMAGDKRPGATKARDAAASEAANSNEHPGGITHADIRYEDMPLPAELEQPQSAHNPNMPIPMIQTDTRDYGNIPRQRQDISGTPYQDRSQPSPASDISHQAHNAAELTKAITQQRNFRAKNYEDLWNRTIDPPVHPKQQKADQSPSVTQSPRMPSNTMITPSQQQSMLHQQATSQMMSPQHYQQQTHQQNPNLHSPVRQPLPPSMRPELQHSQRSSVYNPSQRNPPQTPTYVYQQQQQQQQQQHQPQSHLWGQPPPHQHQPNQPQQSPVTSHHPSMSQHFSPPMHAQQLKHPSQPQHHPPPQAPPQLHHSGSHGNLYGSIGGMAGGMPGAGGAYGGMPPQRNMYGQQAGPGHSGSPNPQHQAYMQQTTAAQQAGMQGWAPPPTQGWGGYPASTGF